MVRVLLRSHGLSKNAVDKHDCGVRASRHPAVFLVGGEVPPGVIALHGLPGPPSRCYINTTPATVGPVGWGKGSF
jgi:hypothetical protein